jgi:DNA repair ATPase RecN
LEERDSQQERWLAALEAKLSHVAQLPAELARIQADLAHVTSEVQTTLPQLRASSEAAQRQLCREVERLHSDISELQALAADHVCLRDVEAMRQEARADVAALRSEVDQLKKTADEANVLLKKLRRIHLKRRRSSLTPLRRLDHRFRRSKRVRKRRLLLSNWTRVSSRLFRRSSISSAGSSLYFCGKEAAMVSKRETFTGDATDTQTH